MPKISLRSYLREIENLIERGMNEESVAHCRFILNYYPKSIETYRLLSKAFLESQRYSEAADILQRILSVVPDDFFALIGMSITREDEGNLDAAIYYMEHAYETQPANVAIQDELRRLYGRRDGVEPPKLRLSRGALVRMYYRGGLNRQAIAEINSALKEDSQRTDLECVLAKIHMDLGEKIPAFEVASRILGKLPYCQDALQILVNILPTTTHADDTKQYVDRLISLDPYLAFISPSCPAVQQVPDNAVIIDRLDWQASQADMRQPAWAQSVGVAVEVEPAEATPDWLSDISPSSDTSAENTSQHQDTQSENEVAPAVEHSESNIPEWMEQAGWSVAEGNADETSQVIEPVEVEESSEISKAEIPDWLKNLAPEDAGFYEETTLDEQEQSEKLEQILPPVDASSATPDTSLIPSETELETPSSEFSQSEPLDILTSIAPEDRVNADQIEAVLEETSIDAIPVAISSTIEAQLSEPVETPEDSLPDWIAQLTPLAPEVSHLSDEIVDSTENKQPDPISEGISDEPLPDWINEIVAADNVGELTVDESLQPSTDNLYAPDPGETNAIEEAELQNPSDTSASIELEEPLEEPPAVSVVEIQPAADILSAPDSSAQLSVSAQPLEVPQNPPDSLPDEDLTILPGIGGLSEQIASAHSPTGESGQADLTDANAAMAWLESLAAKQGAAEETLITPPEDRLETPPSWIQALTSSISDEKSNDNVAAVSLEGDLSLLEQPRVDEIESMSENVGFENSTIGLAKSLEDDSESSNAEPENSVHASETEESSPQPSVQPGPEMDFDTAFAWLESLAAKQGAAEETLLTPTADRTLEIPQLPIEEVDFDEGSSPTQPVRVFSNIPLEPIDLQPVQSISEVTSEPLQSDVLPVILEISADAVKPDESGSEIEAEPTTLPSPEILKHTGILGPLPEWLQGISSETSPEEMQEEIPSPAELPEWLKSLETVVESPSQPQTTQDALPEWLSDIDKKQEELPSDESQSDAENAPDWVKDLADREEIKSTQITGILTHAELLKFDEMEAIPAGTETPQLLLNAAQAALSGGKIEISIRYYTRLIQSGVMVEETIHDLRDSLYRYPVDISIWQTLGDAYMRNNQIQDALDAYTKAEEFLR